MIIFDNPKKRCSIMWCPWKGKYSFGMEGYYECWFHGNEESWYGVVWNTLTRPARFLYNRIRYGGIMKSCCNKFYKMKESGAVIFSMLRGQGFGFVFKPENIHTGKKGKTEELLYCPFCGKKLKSGK